MAKFSLLLLVLATTTTTKICNACTVFVVGKDATIDGSVLVTHSNDGEFNTDPRLVKIPARDYQPNIQRPIYFSPESYPRYVGFDRGTTEYYPTNDATQPPFQPIGYIPQIEHTFAYLEDTYGAVNEHQVGIGESTCSGIFGAIPLGAPNGTALFSIDALTQIAMERTTSAKEAVQLMGDLAVKYGFYGAGMFEGTAESLAVTDPNDAWIFHILPDPTGTSAIWAAQRIPSNGFVVLANMFVIRQVDPNDHDNFLMSDSVHQIAKDYGWWKSDDGLLDFTKIYSDGEYAHKYYSGRRMWGGYHLACTSQNFPAEYTDLQSDPVYPVYCVPDKKISQLDLFYYHRYTYQGTQYDLSKPGNLAGGPFSSPDRWKAGPNEASMTGNWERPIGLYRTSDTYVVQSHSQQTLGAILWYGPASALATVFTPFLVGLSDIPTSFRSGHQAQFERGTSMFWAACVLHNIANLKWIYAIQDITQRQKELETASTEMVVKLEQEYQQSKDFKKVEDTYLANVEKIVESIWSLSDELLFKYATGFVNEKDHMSQMVGYPKWWLEQVGYTDGPPPPPTKPKCCHPPPKNNNTTTTWAVTSGSVGNDVHLTGKAAMKQYLRTMKME